MPKNANRYYVYELIDPRTGHVFYVGKGTGRRAWHHYREWKAKRHINKTMRATIQQIADAGLEPQVRIVRDCLLEDAAFSLERFTIRHHGIENLANHSSGLRTALETAWHHTQQMLRDMLTPKQWKTAFVIRHKRLPSDDEWERYFWVFQNLRDLRAATRQRMTENGISTADQVM